MATTYLTDGPLSSRKSGKTVSRVNTDRSRQRRNEGGGKRNRGGNGQLSAEDMISLFQSMPVPNRGYKNPNAAQPAKMGGGLDWMDKNNSPDLVAQRQNQTDWAQGQTRDRARIAANSAVAEAKALNGYTDASGKFVPGMDKGPPTSAYGTGSVKQLAPGEKARGTMPHPITGEQVFMNDYLAGQEQVQNTKYGPGRDEFGGMKAGPSAAQAGLDYFNPQKMTMPTPVQSRPAPQTTASLQPSNPEDLSALFPGSGASSSSAAVPKFNPVDPDMLAASEKYKHLRGAGSDVIGAAILANEQAIAADRAANPNQDRFSSQLSKEGSYLQSLFEQSLRNPPQSPGWESDAYSDVGPVIPGWLQRKPDFPGVLPSVQSAIGQVPGIAGRALSGLGDFILGPEAARPKQNPNASFESFMPRLASPQAAWEAYTPANQPSHLDQLIRLLFPGRPQQQPIPSNAPWSAYEDLLNTPLR